MSIIAVPNLKCKCGGKLSLSKCIISDDVKLSGIFNLTPEETTLKLSSVKSSVKYLLKCSVCFYPEPELLAQKLIDKLKDNGFEITEEL